MARWDGVDERRVGRWCCPAHSGVESCSGSCPNGWILRTTRPCATDKTRALAAATRAEPRRVIHRNLDRHAVTTRVCWVPQRRKNLSYFLDHASHHASHHAKGVCLAMLPLGPRTVLGLIGCCAPRIWKAAFTFTVSPGLQLLIPGTKCEVHSRLRVNFVWTRGLEDPR